MVAETYIGIDPGKDGGIAVISPAGVYCYVYDKYAYTATLQTERRINENVKVLIEDVHAVQGSKPGATFNFGRNTGFIQGLTFASQITNIAFVRPMVGKEEFNLIHKDKQGSIDVAHALFPNVNLYKSSRCKNMHDGMAEALLMAEYARRHDAEIKGVDNLEL